MLNNFQIKHVFYDKEVDPANSSMSNTGQGRDPSVDIAADCGNLQDKLAKVMMQCLYIPPIFPLQSVEFGPILQNITCVVEFLCVFLLAPIKFDVRLKLAQFSRRNSIYFYTFLKTS